MTGAPNLYALDVQIRLQHHLHQSSLAYIAIYSAEDTHANWKSTPVKQFNLLLSDTLDTVTHLDLPAGHYAARAFIDLNGNGILDFRRGGKPLEPFALSMSDPSRRQPSLIFSNAVVRLSDKTPNLVLTFFYPKPLATPATP